MGYDRYDWSTQLREAVMLYGYSAPLEVITNMTPGEFWKQINLEATGFGSKDIATNMICRQI